MTATYPLPRETRQSAIQQGDGTTVLFSSFAFAIFDIEDVEVWIKPASAAVFAKTSAVTIAKTAPVPLSAFTVTFDTAPAADTDFVVIGRRTHARDIDVSQGGALNALELEKELSKQGTVLQEARRDLDRTMRLEPGAAGGVVQDVPVDHLVKRNADGNWEDAGSATSFATDRAAAEAAKEAAETAQAGSEAARDVAVAANQGVDADLLAAQAARDSAIAADTSAQGHATAAETARDVAVAAAGSVTGDAAIAAAAATSAGTARDEAVAANTAAQTAATAANDNATAAQGSATAAASSATSAGNAQTAAETAQGAAETARTAAETAQAAAETAEANAAASAAAAQVAEIDYQFGGWMIGTAYDARDAVAHNGSSYIALNAHTSAAETEPGVGVSWQSAWEVMAARGAAGPGSGDMLAVTYDPGNVAADAFAMTNMVEGADSKIMTAAERIKLGFLVATGAIDLDAIAARVNQLDAAVVLVDGWDASTGTFPGGGTAQRGESWIVTTGGTVDGVAFSPNDRIIALVDNAPAGVLAGNWLHQDYTDQVLSVAGLTGAISGGALRTALNVENGATADMTGAEIKAAYEAQANTNALTDAFATILGLLTVTQATNLDTVRNNAANGQAAFGWGNHAGAGYLTAGSSVALSGALRETVPFDGTITSSYQVPATGSRSRRIDINGAVTLAPPAVPADNEVMRASVLTWNGASAGTLNTSQWSVVTGDDFDATSGKMHIMRMEVWRTPGGTTHSHLDLVALP